MALTKPRAYQIYDIDYKQAVRVVTVSNITLAGGAPNTVDGVTLSLNDRVLVTGQSGGAQNGIYYVTTLGSGANGTWTRSVDTDLTGELLAGTIVMVTEGTTYADTQWKLTTNDPITIGVTALTFIQNFQGPIIVNGTSNVQIATANSNVTIGVNGTPNVVVYASTGEYVTGLVSVTGNAYVGNILTNGYYYANGVVFGGGGGGTPGGANTQIQYNNNGAFAASAAFTFNNTTNAITASGAFSTGGNITTGVGTAATPQIYYINAANTQYAATLIQRAGSEKWLIGADNTTANGNVVIRYNATTNHVIVTESGIVSVAANIIGGNLLTSGLISATSTITAAANITGGNLLTSGIVSAASHIGSVVSVSGNVTAGGLVGTIYTNSIINTGSNATGNIGSSSLYFNTVFAKATSAQYADVAEIYVADAPYIPGTVLNFGGDKEVTKATSSHSESIAGVVSTDPAYIMNAGQAGEFTVQVALLGRVPCKVVGQIRKGDRLVSSDIAGVAQAMDSKLYSPGCIIGKSLENYDSDQVGVIEVVVGRL